MKPELIQLILIISITILLTILIKNLTKVPRPKEACVDLDDYSFPSGHTSMSFALATFFTHFISNLNIDSTSKYMLIGVIVAGAFFIAFWRLQIRVHTLVQVFAGAFLGIAVASVVVFVFKF